jgi:putative chitinase
MIITAELLKSIASPKGKSIIIDEVAKYLSLYMVDYGINNYLRVCHFLSQATHECDGYNTLREYWGPTPAQKRYEGRKDLGNVVKGDGKRYMGRGIFQITGRYNYKLYGTKLGIDLENNPELAEDAKTSVLIALEYWRTKGLSDLADKDDVVGITKKINGGTNGLFDRRQYLTKAKKLVPQDIGKVEKVDVPTEVPTEVPTLNIVMAKFGDDSDYVADLQNMLIRKGYPIVADGKFGKKTQDAVSDFQKKNGIAVTGNIDTNTLPKLMEA